MFKLNKEVVSGSLVLLIAFNIFSFFNFIYHFSMARMLTPENYGVLAALFSAIYIFGIFSDSIQTIMTKYSSNESNDGKLKNLFKKTFRKAIAASIAIFILFLIVAIFLSRAWGVHYYLIALTGLIIFTSFLTPISRGIMQGRKQFRKLGWNLIAESVLKLSLAILLVYIGARVFGAIIAVVIATFLALLFSFFQLNGILRSKEKTIDTKSIYHQAITIFIVTLAVTCFYSFDVVIAKAVFDDSTAGFYAIASVLGKIIFWGTQPISRAMLPIASDKKKRKKLTSVFWSSFVFVTVLVIVALVVFYFFPDLIVRIFSGKYLDQSASVLFNVGIGMALLSYANLILIYKIAKMGDVDDKKIDYKNLILRKILPISIGIIAEFLILYHSASSIMAFSKGLIMSAVIFLIASWFVKE